MIGGTYTSSIERIAVWHFNSLTAHTMCNIQVISFLGAEYRAESAVSRGLRVSNSEVVGSLIVVMGHRNPNIPPVGLLAVRSAKRDSIRHRWEKRARHL